MPDTPSHHNIAPLRNLGPRSEESLFDKDFRMELPPPLSGPVAASTTGTFWAIANMPFQEAVS